MPFAIAGIVLERASAIASQFEKESYRDRGAD